MGVGEYLDTEKGKDRDVGASTEMEPDTRLWHYCSFAAIIL